MPLRVLVHHALALVLDDEVDDRRGATPGRSPRTGLERVGGLGAAERHLHVRVGVNAAGEQVLAGCVDRLISCDRTQRLGPGRDQGDDPLVVDQHVGGDPTGRRDDGGALDQSRAHGAGIAV
jgi:hypothetical protein